METFEQPHYYTVKDLCKRWGYSPGALAKWRKQGKGPEWTRRGYKTIAYPADAVLRFEAENPILSLHKV